jgi:hypothetical protein
MTKLVTTITLVFLLTFNSLFAQKIILSGPIRISHLIKIQSIISRITESGIKQSVFNQEALNQKLHKINIKQPLEGQIKITDDYSIQKSILASEFSQTVLKYKKKYPKKEIILVCMSKFEEKIPLPFGCNRIEYIDYIDNLSRYRKSIVILALTPNHIEIELEKPEINENLDKSIIDIKATIKSDAQIKSIRYQFGSKGWQTIDNELIVFQNGSSSFWVQNQWPFKGNIKEYITIEIIDIEGNVKKPKFGPFKLIEEQINGDNCFFKYYQKDIHDVALVRNFKSSNVYWFPIYSEIDPSNLSFVLMDELGREHISIRLVEDINFTRNSSNEYCIGIACGDLNIGSSNCECRFDGQCFLRHNSNKSKSNTVEIHLKDWKPTYIAPLAECTK